MWLKKLFTVPEGEKITEKVFCRILVSSICSILLCMTCLFGTTWAWFMVDIENRDNVIQIAEVTVDTRISNSEIEIQKNNSGAYDLTAGTYQLKVTVTNTATEPDVFNHKASVYVVVRVGNAEYYYQAVNSVFERSIYLAADAAVSFAPSWIKPDNAESFDTFPAISPTDTTVEENNNVSVESTTEGETEAPTNAPTEAPTNAPTEAPTEVATEAPTEPSTENGTETPSETEAPQNAAETP